MQISWNPITSQENITLDKKRRGGSWGWNFWWDREDPLQNCACWYLSGQQESEKTQAWTFVSGILAKCPYHRHTPPPPPEMLWNVLISYWHGNGTFLWSQNISQGRQFVPGLALLCLCLNQALSINIIHPEKTHVERASKHNQWKSKQASCPVKWSVYSCTKQCINKR